MFWIKQRVQLALGLASRPDVVSLDPAVQVVYAIGDVHGCLEQLQRLERSIVADAEGMWTKSAIIYLGDFVDRGPNASGVLNHLTCPPQDHMARYAVIGNHETAMLSFLKAPLASAAWLHNGGAETLRSYGVSVPVRPSRRDRRRLALAAEASIPAAHTDFIKALPTAIEWGAYLFVHAGIRPVVPLGRQSEADLTEIRGPFLQHQGPFSHVVVHGHSPVRDACSDACRISVDTACFATGRLSAARIDQTSVQFLTVNAAGILSNPANSSPA